jgi:hypothetical protein
MRNLSTAHQDARRSWRSGLAALILSGITAGLSANAQAQTPYPPTGTVWDCVLSGSGQKGIAFITFSDDRSFSGYQILSSSPESAQDTEGRNLGGGIGRGIELNGNTGNTNVFGFDQFGGPWAYDAKGRVIGNFVQIAGESDEASDNITNSISFVAKVVPGKRLTLVASTSNGKITYKGVPHTDNMPSLGGAWYGTKQVKGQSFTEFYTFASMAESNPFEESYPDLSEYPGIYYTFDGEGPGYEIVGFSMLSSQKKIAFAFQNYAPGSTNGTLNASFGSFSTSSKGVPKATTSGVEAPDKAIHYTFMQPLYSPTAK